MIPLLLTTFLLAPMTASEPARNPSATATQESEAPQLATALPHRHPEQVERAQELIAAGKSEQAVALLRAVLETDLAELEEDDPRLIQAMSNLAYALASHGSALEARDMAYSALQRTELQEGPPVARAMVERLLAEINEAMGEIEEAQKWIEDACRDLADSFGRTPMAAETHEIGTRIAFAAGDLEAAQLHAERSLAIYERFLGAASEITARPLGPLAAILARRGQPRSAVLLSRTARGILEATLEEHSSEVMGNMESELAWLMQLGETAQAAAIAERLAALSDQAEGKVSTQGEHIAARELELTLRNCALLLETGAAREAARRAAMQLGKLQSQVASDPFDELRLLVPLAHARFFLQDAEGAFEAVEAARARMGIQAGAELRVAVDGLRGRILLELKREDDALESLRSAYRALEEGDSAAPGLRLELLLALIRAEERVKGASVGLVDLVEMVEGPLASTSPAELARLRVRALRLGQPNFLGDLAQAWMRLVEADSARLPQAFAALERIRERERAANGAWQASSPGVSSTPIVTLDDVRSALENEGHLALRYLWTGRGLWAIAIGRDLSRDLVLELGSCEKLAGTLLEVRRSLEGLDPRLDLAALARVLLAPLEDRLAGTERVTVVADGPLAYFPFEALPTRSSTPGGPLWIDRWAVDYAPSFATGLAEADIVSDLDGTQVRIVSAPQKHGELTLSHARLSLRGRFEDVPAAELGPTRLDGVSLSSGSDAREARFKTLAAAGELRHLGLLELDLPTFVDGQVPSATGLAFSPEALDDSQPGWRREDGFLDTHELASIDLAGSLLLLPRTRRALDPELHQLTGEAGQHTLLEALRRAGARSVLLASWPNSSPMAGAFLEELRERAASAGEAKALLATQRAWLARARSAADDAALHPGIWSRIRAFGLGSTARERITESSH